MAAYCSWREHGEAVPSKISSRINDCAPLVTSTASGCRCVGVPIGCAWCAACCGTSALWRAGAAQVGARERRREEGAPVGIRRWPMPHWRWNRPARGTFDSVTPRAVPRQAGSYSGVPRGIFTPPRVASLSLSLVRVGFTLNRARYRRQSGSHSGAPGRSPRAPRPPSRASLLSARGGLRPTPARGGSSSGREPSDSRPRPPAEGGGSGYFGL